MNSTASEEFPSPASTFATGPDLEQLTQEVRFAVVMYGGVSLAIYINGIAQELLHLVRATAPAGVVSDPSAEASPHGPDARGLQALHRTVARVVRRLFQRPERPGVPQGPASGRALPSASLEATEPVYRKVAYLLANDRPSLESVETALEHDGALPARFVIDIVSGTSAGGINGIFLAKALANGQAIQPLEKLWIEEGDIALLINDRRSVEGPLDLQDPPESLLNSRRMYWKLLDAFSGMGARSSGPYVDELDLFVTTTDIQGVALPIRLADRVVFERRHRNVFHCVFSRKEASGEDADRNDFDEAYDPFLAYAARCTSSFPFAFEPMQLCDTDLVLDRLAAFRRRGECRSDSDAWKPFFKTYVDAGGSSSVPFTKRSFGDGGYLDNKPFTYVTQTLAKRHADLPVDRKLIYIEPSPEHPEEKSETDRRPDVVMNSTAALLKLPRYETIREDLERVLERNRLVARVNRIIKGVDRDVDLANAERSSPLTDDEWAELDLGGMVKTKGPGYVAYHRLDIAAVTDDLATLVARVAQVDEASDFLIVFRALIRAWRDRSYVEHKLARGPHDARPTMNRFLTDFNLAYKLRRLTFLRSRIDQLYRCDEQAMELMKLCKVESPQRLAEDGVYRQRFRHALIEKKRVIGAGYRRLRQLGRSVRARGAAGNPVHDQITALATELEVWLKGQAPPGPTTSPILNYFLADGPDGTPAETLDASQIEERAVERAKLCLERNDGLMRRFNGITDVLSDSLRKAASPVDRACRDALKPRDGGSSDEPEWAVQTVLYDYYMHYDDRDMILFPILYGTDVGEGDAVEIFRISPEDATALIDERSKEWPCVKLAGTAVANFGGFLEERWRRNDILWGRLDGAERLIRTLLPHRPAEAEKLIGEAQAEIVLATLKDLPDTKLKDLITESFRRPKERKTRPDDAALIDFLAKLKCRATDSQRRELDRLLDDRQLREYLDRTRRTHGHPDPESTLQAAARATTVVGRMLEMLSAERNVNRKYVAWVARFGRIFWNLVEVAVPRSIPSLVFQHWLKLLYFFEMLMITGGVLLVNQTVQQFGLIAFGVTAGLHVVVTVLAEAMQSRTRWRRLARALLILLVAALLAAGMFAVVAVVYGGRTWDWLAAARSWIENPESLGKEFVPLAVVLGAVAFLVVVLRRDVRALVRDLRRRLTPRARPREGA